METRVQRLRQLGGSLTSAPSPIRCRFSRAYLVAVTRFLGIHVDDSMQSTLTNSCCLLKQSL